MAVVNLLFVMQSITAGNSPWLSVAGVICWLYLAYRTTKTPRIEEAELTADQTLRLKIVTRRFVKETADILAEGHDDESNNGKDKETDKKQSDDE